MDKQDVANALIALEKLKAASEADLQEAKTSGTERAYLYRMGQRDAIREAIIIIKAWYE